MLKKGKSSMATIADYRDAFDPGNVVTIPRMNMTTGHRRECINPRKGDFPEGYGDDTCECDWRSEEPTVTLAVQGLGGTTPGKAYTDNDWFYELRVDGDAVLEGSELHSGNAPKTAEQMGAALLSTLLSYVERCYYPGGGTEQEVREIVARHEIPEPAVRFAITQYDRLSLYVAGVEGDRE